ncbi:MAG: 16S rRNA (cytosine(1402)-N(4))-methyltransferase RsmH [Muribaculaceae bacterium]|nr:16S rRNA (cytosine(1402)-N(4))-methyltransferase RsmH [Muribaculaceae bacterium]
MTDNSPLPYHIPALLPQVIEGLDIKPDGIYVDVTFGGGGHSRAILERLSPSGHLYSFDQDAEAVANAFADPRFTIVHANFKYLTNFMAYYDVEAVDGILADLGVSFHHFDTPERGFSFRWDDSPLDMRMNPSMEVTAAQLIADSDVDTLTDIFRNYGELKNGRQIAVDIVKARDKGQAITTAAQLRQVVGDRLNPAREKKDLACVYQALRIAVNNELDALKKLLVAAACVLKPGGRIAVITYHSLEDRLVKNFFRTGNLEGDVEKDFFGNVSSPFKLITSKPIVPDDNEVQNNPRARSAKLRVAVRK